MQNLDHEYFMQAALSEAQKAFEQSEIPIGAVIVYENKIIGRGYNRTIALKDATAHAEMLAITSAAEKMGDWRLEKTVLYSTVEPCTMCAGAAVLSRIETIVYGAKDPKFGACGSIFDIPGEKRLNHRIEVVSGIMEPEAIDLMQLFFQEVRKKKERGQ